MAVVLLAILLFSITIKGLPWIVDFSNLKASFVDGGDGFAGWKHWVRWEFFTEYTSRKPKDAGIRAPLWGSIWVCAICAAAALPIGVGTAIYMEEFATSNRFTRFIQTNIRNLAGVPSIVYGILALTAFARMFGLFGTSNDPSLFFGYAFHNEYRTVAGHLVTVPVSTVGDRVMVAGEDGIPHEQVVESASGGLRNGLARWSIWTAPPAPPRPLRDGDAALLHVIEPDGREVVTAVTVRVLADDLAAPSIDGPPATVSAKNASSPTRTSSTSWWSMALPFGGSVLAGGLTLMLVILPIIIISSQEAFRAVPSSLRQASLAMGATTWQTVRRVTLPAAIPMIMTGSILAISRAIGEAAPLLVLGVPLFISDTPVNLMSEFTVLPLQIYNWAGRPQADFHAIAAAAIIVLLAVLLTFNALAVIIRQKLHTPLT
ncbi:MAG: ABC transporter permease subunit [Phycisphaerae bacterium]|nr:ABC transporter permease subunit [Phycisphaerae bacterium]